MKHPKTPAGNYEHSPLPWKRVGATEVWEERSVYRICRLSGAYSPPANTTRANAELICRAVNSHADLLQALRDLLADHIAMSRERHALAHHTRPWTELPVQATARQAIAKAERGEV